MKKLDTSKPYGTVHGDEASGRAFEQAGAFFDSKGEEWTPPVVAEPAAEVAPGALDAAYAKGLKDAAAGLDAKIAAAVAAAMAGVKKKDETAKV